MKKILIATILATSLISAGCPSSGVDKALKVTNTKKTAFTMAGANFEMIKWKSCLQKEQIDKLSAQVNELKTLIKGIKSTQVSVRPTSGISGSRSRSGSSEQSYSHGDYSGSGY